MPKRSFVNMREAGLIPTKGIGVFFYLLSEWTALALVALLPLFYWPGFVDAVEFPKQVLLVVGASLCLIGWLGGAVITKKVGFRLNWVNAAALAYVAAVAISAFANGARQASLSGANGIRYNALLTVVCLLAVYLSISNLPGKIFSVTRALRAIVISGGLVSLVVFLQFAGLHLLPGSGALPFGYISSQLVFGGYSAVIAVLAVGLLIGNGAKSIFAKIIFSLAGLCAFAALVALNFWGAYAALIAGLVVMLVISAPRFETAAGTVRLVLPMALIVAAMITHVFRLPFPVQAPGENVLGYQESFRVTLKSLAASPLWGSGPGTFSDNFALYRDASINNSPFWNADFNRAFPAILTEAATLGLLGTVSFIALAVAAIFACAKRLSSFKRSMNEAWPETLALLCGFVASVAALLICGTSITGLFVLWLLLGLMARNNEEPFNVTDARAIPKRSVPLVLSFAALIALVLYANYAAMARWAGESRLSRVAYGKNMETSEAVKSLEKAAFWDPRSDAVARLLSRYYANEAYAAFLGAGNGSGSEALAVLAASSVKEAKRAVDLNPEHADNWMNLGDVYKTVAPFVDNAAAEAVKSYEKAASLFPSAPAIPAAQGEAYVLAANLAKEKGGGSASGDNKDAAAGLLSEAEKSFLKALSLKSDYAPAIYQLSVVYSVQGRGSEAVGMLEDFLSKVPLIPQTAFYLGLAYHDMKEDDKAIDAFGQAIRLGLPSHDARWMRKEIFESRQEWDKAIAEVKAILEVDPENISAKSELGELEKKKAP